MADVFFAFTLGTTERRTTIAVMVIVCAVLVFALIGCLIAYFAAGQTIALLIGVVVFAEFPLLFVLAGYAPKGAVVTREDLRIVRRKRAPVVLSGEQIVSLERIEASVLRGCIRTFGVGGFLGSWGRFRCKQLGAFRAYMTNTKSLVLIRTVSQGLFVISPDSPDAFVARATEAFGLSPSINPSV